MSFTFLPRLAAIAVLLPLAACGGVSNEPPPPCPTVVAINDAARLTRFTPGGADLTEVVYEAVIEDVQYACTYDGPVIEMAVTITIVATEGPANATGEAAFNYFVAVATAEREILAREDFDVALPFQGNATRVRFTETVEPVIPLNPGEDGNDFRLFVGFDLTEEELEYNRGRL